MKRKSPFEFWQSVTGSLEQGESAANAATRELYEETGIQGKERLINSKIERQFRIDPRWRNRYAPGITMNTEHDWRCHLPSPCNIVIDTSEHSEFVWLPLDDAIDQTWSWTNKAALRNLRWELRQ